MIKSILKLTPEEVERIERKLERIEELLSQMTTGNISHKKGNIRQYIYGIREELKIEK